MRWSERQRAMLQEMGIRLWFPQPGPPQEVADTPPAALLREGGGAGAPQDAVPAVARVDAERPRAASVPAGVAHVVPTRADGPAGRADIASMDWPQLRAAVAGCTACVLCQSRRSTVFGVGSEQAHWMIVGEAPGEQEDAAGEPFVGKAGQLLDNMLRAVGLSRAPGPPERQVFIANTLKCRPPNNRNPQPDELAQCEPFLLRQIELVRPRIILAMGRFALQSLLRSDLPVGRLRGHVHSYHGVPLVATYHPAYLLRNPEDKARCWEDLCLARDVLSAGARP